MDTTQKVEASDSQVDNQTENKETAQTIKPITEDDVKAAIENQKAEVKTADTQTKQEKQASEIPVTPLTPSKPVAPKPKNQPPAPSENGENKKDDQTKTVRPHATNKPNKAKKSGQSKNANVQKTAAPHGQIAPNKKSDVLPNGEGMHKLATKPASVVKANATKAIEKSIAFCYCKK